MIFRRRSIGDHLHETTPGQDGAELAQLTLINLAMVVILVASILAYAFY